MNDNLEQLLIRAAFATHDYWQAVSQATDALERGDYDDTDRLTQLADQSRELSRQAVELYQKEGGA